MNSPFKAYSFAFAFCAALFFGLPPVVTLGYANTTTVDLTIEVGGDLALHGGVVTVYPIPVAVESWSSDAMTPAVIKLEARYAEIQLRYPAKGTFVYRFKPSDSKVATERHPSHALSIIGTDEKNQGPQMTVGFKDAYSSGGRIIRIPARDEYAGQGEATRSNARWGKKEGWYPPPPANERSARSLTVVVEADSQRSKLTCTGSALVQICGFSSEQWERVTALWWRQLAESRLERLDYFALRRCYDSSFFGGVKCDENPTSNEPEYLKRK
jgi:hypothetical protein